jgi:tetratricopeptide (TPR) repeat protein
MPLLGDLVKKVIAVVSGRGFYLILGSVLVVAIVLRTLFLSADPPAGITKSQDFSTDPFQYVYFAKNSVDHGVSNPYHDPRFSQWEKSTQNLLAWVVYSVAGTGRVQGNMVGVIFNLLSILLLALTIKNFGARLGALIFAMLAACDFTLVSFARTPFLEASQNFWICGSVYLFSRRREHWLYYAGAGLVCGIAAFFGKMIALFMLGTFTTVWLLLYLNEVEARKELTKSAIRFYAGFAITTVVWLFYSYLPSRGEMSGYLSEQAIGLYGAPKALDSIGDFIWQFVSLLWEQWFFDKMPLITICTFVAGAGILLYFARKSPGKKLFAEFNVGWVILFLWFAIGYLSLFPWNYRPLRYQTTLMFPAMALTGLAISYSFEHFKQRKSASAKGNRPDSGHKLNAPVAAILWAIWLMPLFALLLLWIGSGSGTGGIEASFRQVAIGYGAALLALGALAAVGYRSLGRLPNGLASAGVVVSALLLIGIVGYSVIKFAGWSEARQYSLITADRDLGAILNQGAVISGPYGPALTQQNGFGSVIHMFGVKRIDRELFNTLPITHLVMDEGNEKRAREDYKEMMDRASFVTRYFIRGVPVRVYRISSASANPDANKYVPSDYERAQEFLAEGNNDSAQVCFDRYLSKDIPNYSVNLYVADALYSQNKYEDALNYYRKVQLFAPRDALSAVNTGYSYLAVAGTRNNPACNDSALTYLKIAHRVFANEQRLADLVTQLERRKK